MQANLELKIRNLEGQLSACSGNGPSVLDSNGLSGSRRPRDDPWTKSVNGSKSDFEFAFDLPDLGAIGAQNFPGDNFEASKAKRGKFFSTDPSRSLGLRDAGSPRKSTSGLGGSRGSSARRPAQVQSSVLAAMSFIAGPSLALPTGTGSTSTYSRFERISNPAPRPLSDCNFPECHFPECDIPNFS